MESIVFVGAHPDDTEGYAASAFLLREMFALHVVDLTRGELGLGRPGFLDGSTARIRTAEEEAACAFLGATPHFLFETDGDAYAGRESVEALASLLRAVRPRAVFTHWPIDTHPDHIQATATLEHALHRLDFLPERYFYEVLREQTRNFRPVYSIDVSSSIDRKLSMLSRYACQVDEAVLAEKRDQAAERGRETVPPVAFAETFSTFDGARTERGVLESLGPLCHPFV